MNMAGPDVLGIPAPAGILTGLSVAADTVLAASVILALGLGMLMILTRLCRKRLDFLSELHGTIRAAYLPTLTIAMASAFLSLILTYLLHGNLSFFAESPLIGHTENLPATIFITRIIFLAGVALTAGGAFIATANHVRAGDERATIFGLRIVCGAALASACARIIDIWITSAHHPANPELAGIIVVGSLIAAAVAGTAILGILRPRQSLWSAATAIILLIGVAASSYIDIHFIEEAYRAAAPTFEAAHRTQPTLMTFFFSFTACAIAVIGLMVRWWIRDVKSEAQAKPIN